MKRFVVEVYDENDELVGYAVCAATNPGYRLEPEVYGVRSQAHAALPLIKGERVAHRHDGGIGTITEIGGPTSTGLVAVRWDDGRSFLYPADMLERHA